MELFSWLVTLHSRLTDFQSLLSIISILFKMYVSDVIRVWYLYSFHLPAPQDTTPTITAFSVAGSTVISGPEKIRANENFLFVQSGLRAFHNNSFSDECQTQSAKVFALP